MNNIKVAILQEPYDAGHISSFLARLTQRGHDLNDIESVKVLYNKPENPELIKKLAGMQHGTIKRFDSYTVIVIGASRRFLAQIRTHQHADFVSGSLQYSDWSSSVFNMQDMFVVPYSMLDNEELKTEYLQRCYDAYETYQHIATVDHDAAGFIMPNGLRNILVIQANVQEWQYIIKLRGCARNSDETRYTVLQIWDALLHTRHGSMFFSPEIVGFDCQFGGCKEAQFSCHRPYPKGIMPMAIIKSEYPLCLED